MSSTAPARARERVLEKKIVTLEQRLVLVERFVEMRFCETFRDFQTRHIPSNSDFDDDDNAKDKAHVSKNSTVASSRGKKTQPTTTVGEDDTTNLPPPPPQEEEDESGSDKKVYITRSGRKSTRVTAKSVSSSTSTPKPSTSTKANDLALSGKMLKVSVPRLDDIPKAVEDNSRFGPDEGREGVTVIKIHYETEDEEQSEVDGNDEGGDEYFTFASGGDENLEDPGDGEEDDDEGAAADPTDEDWNASGGEDDEKDEDYGAKGNQNQKRKPKSTPATPTPRKRIKKSQKNRKKERVPARLELLPEGVRVEALNPSENKECPVCHRHCKKEVYEQHLETHVKERHLKCPFCDKRFFTNKNLYQHKRTHLTEKYGKSCRLCSKVFVENFKVLYHERACIRKRLEENMAVDPEIVQDVRNRSKNVDLKWPDPNETIPEGMKKCFRCKRFIAEDLFIAHVRELHSSWKCSTCDAKFTAKNGLVRHLLRYHGENKVTCEICAVVFESRKDYKNHYPICPEGGRRKYNRRLRLQKNRKAKLVETEQVKDAGVKQKGEEIEEESLDSLPEDMDTPPEVVHEEVVADEGAVVDEVALNEIY